MNSDNKPRTPSRTNVISLNITFGNAEMIPTIIMREIPLPIPRSVIRSPNHMRNKVPVTMLIIPVNVNIKPGSMTTGCPFAERLGRKTATTPYDCMDASITVPYRVIWVIFFLPASPSFCNLWKYGTTDPIN